MNPNQYYISQSPASLRTALAQDIPNIFISMLPTQAEQNTGVNVSAPWYPFGNMLRYGFVPNSLAAAASNTTIAQTLFNPSIAAGPSGRFYFPNTTGADIYYFSGFISIRDACHWDLQGCTINFTRTYQAGDNTNSFIMAIRDVTIENGYIQVNYDGTVGGNAGATIRFGSRPGYAFGQYTSGIFDQDDLVANGLPVMGNLVLRNLHFKSNNPYTGIAEQILMYGGLRGVLLENIDIDGQGVGAGGVYYEFGFASKNGSGVQTNWTSSHATNMIWRNIRVTNLLTGVHGSSGVGLGGAHHCIIENLVVDTATIGIYTTPGEALCYRPWSPTDLEGAKRNIAIRNVTLSNISGTGIVLGGASSNTGGYLSGIFITPEQQRDLMSFSVDGFAINAAGFGISLSGTSDIRNGRLDGASASGQVVIGDDVQNFTFTNVEILNSSGDGIRGSLATAVVQPTTVTSASASIASTNNFQAGEGVIFTGSMGAVTGLTAGTIYYVIAAGLSGSAFEVSATVGGAAITPAGTGSATPTVAPARLKVGTITNCKIAGNSVIGAFFANCKSIKLIGCRMGYSIDTDGVAETTQTNSLQVAYATNGGGVEADGCETHTASGTAYVTTGTVAVGNTLCGFRNPKGETTTAGTWEVNGAASFTTANITDKTNAINTTGKFLGRYVYNSTATKLMIAQGSVNTSNWVSADAVTTITPV